MAKKSYSTGPAIHRLIEQAPVSRIIDVIRFRDEGAAEDFEAALPSDKELDAFRSELLSALAAHGADALKPLETRCRRILDLADGKGATSLDTIAMQRMDHEQYAEFQGQPDEVARSIWVFLTCRPIFEDAESFHFARRYREHAKLYDAFEVEALEISARNAAEIDEAALGGKITDALDLNTRCSVHALDLPATDAHPASIMLIVRHGGPLSSVFDHRDDGEDGLIYYRPRNEATLIYTPGERRIEVCGDTAPVRQKVADSFAEETLGQDVSKKPLTWRRYNLSRFRSSLDLPTPEVDGFEIIEARVVEAQIRLGKWSRALTLKVSIGDDIEWVADKYLGANNLFETADSFSRIRIAIRYHVVSETKKRSLQITISSAKACNVAGLKNPDERGLGFALLKSWGILSAFEEIPAAELGAIFPQLVRLFDRAEDVVSGAYLAELGLDAQRLIAGGIIEPKGREEIILIDDDDPIGEADVVPSRSPGMVRREGAFGEDAGDWPADDLRRFKIKTDWLQETLVKQLRPVLTRSAAEILDDNLMLVGALAIDDRDTPVYYARRLADRKVHRALDIMLRGRTGAGVVLSAGTDLPRFLGPNVIVDICSGMGDGVHGHVLSADALKRSFRAGRNLAVGGATPTLLKSGADSATLRLPGQTPLSLLGANQIRIFERLIEAHQAGAPDVKSGRLLDGMAVRSVQNAFRLATWETINGVYIRQGDKTGYWRLGV